jgi:hypothetical protein
MPRARRTRKLAEIDKNASNRHPADIHCYKQIPGCVYTQIHNTWSCRQILSLHSPELKTIRMSDAESPTWAGARRRLARWPLRPVRVTEQRLRYSCPALPLRAGSLRASYHNHVDVTSMVTSSASIGSQPRTVATQHLQLCRLRCASCSG